LSAVLVALPLAMATHAVIFTMTVVLLHVVTSRRVTSAARTLRERYERQLRLWDLYLDGYMKGE
jgi:uncharacterized membrane protein